MTNGTQMGHSLVDLRDTRMQHPQDCKCIWSVPFRTGPISWTCI